MYCSNCGKKVDEKAVVCVGCGCPLNNNYYANQPVKVKKPNRGIASMVLGIIGAFLALCEFTSFDELDAYDFFIENSSYLVYALETVIVPMILAIIGISLGCVSRNNEKNGFNTAGIWLAIATFIMCTIQFVYIVTY